MTDEFDIIKHTFNALKSLDIPVFYVARKEVSAPFVIFNITGEKGNKYWDDEEQETIYRVTVNIFTKDNFVKYKNEILKLMKQAGFIKHDIPACIFLEDVDVYNQPIEFKLYREIY